MYSEKPRKIIHFDMDAFYASVEVRDDPRLKGRPGVVGGSPQSRGVVCSASYEARAFGVRSAMSCFQAWKLCPEAVFVKPSFSKYSEASAQIRAVFDRYTPLVEPLSLDEAYLDVTDNAHGLYAVQIARRLQREIFAETRLTGSAGVAPNKLLAKIASDMNKPRGLTVVLPEQVLAFMEMLPLRKIHGIGPATEARLAAKGFNLCRDVWPYSAAELTERLGNMGEWLYARSRGMDERPVQASRERKSLGHETTFATDTKDRATLEGVIDKLAGEIGERLTAKKVRGRTITLKVKYADFTQITRRMTLPVGTDQPQILAATGKILMEQTEATARKVRLLGLSLSNLD
jgi:DNA polymerase-4